MPLSIYPPTLQSTQPAFLASTSSYRVYFTLQSVSSFDEIGNIQIRVIKQSNNKSIVNVNKYPDACIYKPSSDIQVNKSNYSIEIDNSDLAEQWQPGYLYKIQIRFSTYKIMYKELKDFADWKAYQINNNTLSEWSTVMIIKAISAPDVYIKNAESIVQDVISTQRTEATLTPLFVGACNMNEANKEVVDKYKFDLYAGEEVDQTELIESSGWLQHDSVVNTVDSYRFKTILTNNENYTVVYTIVTVNGYQESSAPYTFLASRIYYSVLEDVSLTVDDEDIYCRENGCIRLYLTSKSQLNGAFVITRTSEKSNYEVWEDLQYLIYDKGKFDDTLIYTDFTIESGVRYKYAFQQENSEKLRTSPVYDATNAAHSVDFEHVYLYRNGVQLKLSFNQKVTSFKHTTLTSKQDTLGDKYPHIARNGNAYYAEFPITGLISFQMDKDQTFFTLDEKGFYYNGELVIPRDKLREFDMMRGDCAPWVDTTNDTGVITDYNHITINSDLTDDNIFVERKFREKAEEFLNDLNYKLYKSPTEGNIAVALTNVSLTPNASLGRMIFEFSATAYEVLENNLENLDEYGIIHIGQFETLVSDEIFLSFGQVRGIYTTYSDVDIYALIKEQEEVRLGENYKSQLERVRSFWVERYPDNANFTAQLNELYAYRNELLDKGESTEEIDRQIAEYENLAVAITTGPQRVHAILNVNGKNILVAANKIYSLREPVTRLRLVRSTYPIIINYVCELTQQEDTTVGVISGIDASRIWGQVSGVFTGTDKVLKTYNYEYGPGKLPLRVYNGMPDRTIVYDKRGNVLVDNTNFNVYKTVNILDAIKEETRKQVELIYNVDGGFHLNEEGRWSNAAGTMYYDFSDMILFDIEADPGTIIYISKNRDGTEKTPIKIGPTGRYILNPADGFIEYIALAEPRFIIVNYKCLTNQMKIKKG